MRQSALENRTAGIREPNRGIEFSSGHETPKMLIVDDDPSVVRLLADHCARMASRSIPCVQRNPGASQGQPDQARHSRHRRQHAGNRRLSVCSHLLGPDRRPINVIVITGSRDPDSARKMRRLWRLLRAQGTEFLERNWKARWRRCHPRMPRASGTPAQAKRPLNKAAPARAARRRRQQRQPLLQQPARKTAGSMCLCSRRTAGPPDRLPGRTRRHRDRLFHANGDAQ